MKSFTCPGSPDHTQFYPRAKPHPVETDPRGREGQATLRPVGPMRISLSLTESVGAEPSESTNSDPQGRILGTAFAAGLRP